MGEEKTIRYTLGDRKFDIPESEVSAFEQDMPEATVRMTAGGKDYDILAKERSEFMQDFPDAQYAMPTTPVAQSADDEPEAQASFIDVATESPSRRRRNGFDTESPIYEQNKEFIDEYENREKASLRDRFLSLFPSAKDLPKAVFIGMPGSFLSGAARQQTEESLKLQEDRARYKGLKELEKEARKNPYIGMGEEELGEKIHEVLGEDEQWYYDYLGKKSLAEQAKTAQMPGGGGYVNTVQFATPEQEEAAKYVRENRERFNELNTKVAPIERAIAASPEHYEQEQEGLADAYALHAQNLADKEKRGHGEGAGKYDAASRFLEKAEQEYNAPNRYYNRKGLGAVRGAIDRLASLNTATMGLSEIFDDVNVIAVQDKIAKVAERVDKEIDEVWANTSLSEKERNEIADAIIDRAMQDDLDKGDINLLQAVAAYNEAKNMRSQDKTAGYNAGQMAAESAQYMMEFMLTDGIFKGVKGAVTKGMARWAEKNLGGKIASEGLGTLAGTVARTQLMPSTYKNILENRMMMDEEGNREMSWWEAIAKGEFDAINDNFFENSGEWLDAGFKRIMQRVAKAAPSTKFGSLLSNYFQKGARVLETGGINSYGSEMAEEILGAANSSLWGYATGNALGDKQALPSLIEAENFGTMALSFLPMMIPQAVGTIRGYREMQGRYNTALEHLQPLVDNGSLDAKKVQNIADSMGDLNAKELSQKITELGKEVVDKGGELPQTFLTDMMTLVEKRMSDTFMGDEWADSADKRALAEAMIEGENANEANLYDINRFWQKAKAAGENAGYSDAQLDEDPMQLYAEAMRIKDSDPKGSQILMDMARANALKAGVNSNLESRVSAAESEMNQRLGNLANNGWIMPAQTKDGRVVYIKSWDAKVDENGNVTLPEAEGGLSTPVLVMDESGNAQAIPASELTTLPAESLDTARDESSRILREQYREYCDRWAKTISDDAKVEDVKNLEGRNVVIRTPDGRTARMKIEAIDDDNMVAISGNKKDIGGNTYIPATQAWDMLVLDSQGNPIDADLYDVRMKKMEEMAKVAEEQAQAEAAAEPTPVAEAEPDIPMVEGKPSANGNDYLNGTFRVTIGGNPVDATVTGVEDDGISVVLSYKDAKGNEKRASMDAQSFGQNALNSRPQPIEQPVAAQGETPQPEAEAEPEQVDYNMLAQEGNVEAGTQAVVADFGEDAMQFVDNNLKAAKSAADKAQKATPKSTDPAEFKKEAAEIRLAKESTQKDLAFWQGVKTALETPAVEEAPAVAEEAPVASVAEEAPEVAPTPAETPVAETPVAETPEQTPTLAEEPTPTPEPAPAPQARNANEPVLSEEKDYYGNQFITAPDGTIDFGSIPAESGLMAGPIRISIGDKGVDGREAYGLAATGLSYPRAMRHIQSVLGNPARIVRGMDTDGKGYNSIIIAGRRGPNGTPFVELTEEDGYWMLHDIGVDDTGRAINSREEIYTRGGKPRAEGSYDLSVRPDEKARSSFSLAQRRRTLRSTKRVKAAIEKYAKPLNTDIVIVESLDDIPEDQKVARMVMERYMADHSQPLPEAWFNNGKIYFVAPAFQGRSEQYIASKIAHEVVAHYGLRGLLQDKFDDFCDRVWNAMDEQSRAREVEYVLNTQSDEVGRQYRLAEAKEASGRKLTKKERDLLQSIRRMAADEYVAHLAENTEANPTLWQRIVEWIKEFLAGKGINLDLNDNDIIAALARSRERLENAVNVETGKAGMTAIQGEVKGDPQFDTKAKDGEMVSDETPDHTTRFSLSTWEDGGREEFIKFVEKQIAEGNLPEDAREKFITKMDKVYAEAKEIYYSGDFEAFNEWSDKEVVRDSQGNAIYSVIKPNNEYGMNLDFSLVCKKRRVLNAVLNEMIDRDLVQFMGSANDDLTIAQINDIIRKYGFETACRLCFVDAKRFRQVKVADDFVHLYNGLVNKLIPRGSRIKAGYFDFAKTGRHNYSGQMLDQMSDDRLNIAALQKIVDLEDKAKKDKPGRTVTYKIAKHLLENPQDRKFVQREDFISTRGFEAVKAENEAILGLYNSKKGSGGPKASEGDVQYLGDVANANWSPEAAFKVGGVRIQSFSDFVPHMVFDYMQMIADLAAGGYPAHAYTKEAVFAKLFGLTGIKLNLSLVPSVVEGGIAPGLDADGNYTWQEGETFPYDEAVRIQNTDGYRENCGTIAVGISDAHILKMMADPNIRMVIPYHKSGLNKKIAIYNGIDKFKDYTDSQNTRYADGKKLSKADHEKEPNYNELLQSEGNPNAAAKRYLDWCKENNYIPKFEQFAYDEQGNMREGYYKLLEDFTTNVPNAEGGFDYYPQRAIELNLPQEGSPLGSTSDLMRSALEEEEATEMRLKEDIAPIVDEVEEMLGTRFSLAPSGAEMYRESADLFDAAKERFGTTYDIREAGYVLPDGTMLDFSGRHSVSGDSSFLNGERHVDHRDIQDLEWERDLNTPSGLKTDMADFIGRGAIRIDANSGAINLAKKPTSEQSDKLRRLIERNDGDVWVDFGADATDHYAEYEGAKPTRVLNDIARYFDEGVKPEGNTLFSLAEDKNNVAQQIDKRIAELQDSSEQSPQSNPVGNSADLNPNGNYSPASAGAQSVVPSTKVNKKLKDAKDLAKRMASFIMTLQNDTTINAENFAEKVVGALAVVPGQEQSQYVHFNSDGDNSATLRISDHYGNARNIILKGVKTDRGYSIVLSDPTKPKRRFRGNKWAKVNEYVYDNPDHDRLVDIAKTIFNLFDKGIYVDLAEADDQHISPTNNTLFSLSNANQRIFISNAEKAVESIKQDKATPEQWKKMIEKNGGLKAGEDKWLGLSMWLDASDRKTLTKQEVLDFIGENEIKIEETVYGEMNLKQLQEEFDTIPFETNEAKWEDADRRLSEFYSEMEEKYGEDYLDLLNLAERATEENLIEERDSYEEEQDVYDAAFNAMVDKYGDDFGIAFTHTYGRLDVADEDAAAYFLGVNPINRTRLAYTTDGLDNKQEIALTVPTIEPWNESDQIHFGDAGEGRAISWARFGDAHIIEEPSAEVRKAYEEAMMALSDYRSELANKYDSLSYFRKATEEELAKLDALKTEERARFVELQKAITEGDKKVLFIDEIQSKRHQEAREKGGYRDDTLLKKAEARRDAARAEYDKYHDALLKKYGDYNNIRENLTPEENEESQRLYYAFRDAENVVARNGFDPMADEDYRNIRAELDAHQNSEAFKNLADSWREVMREFKAVREATGGAKRNAQAIDILTRKDNIEKAMKPFQDKTRELQGRLEERERTLVAEFNEQHKSTIPAAPFEKNWPELTMKRMLRYAAENGYDVVAWTTGEQQAERYGLNQVVDKINAYDSENKDNDRVVEITTNIAGQKYTMYVDRETGIIKRGGDELAANGKHVADIIGKELAIKVLGTNDDVDLQGNDLRIGGEGMKGFYDDILPRFMNKYGKQWGVSTKDALVELNDGAKIEAHTIDVNDAMKSSVMEGQTMFSLAKSTEEFDENFERAKENKGIVTEGLSDTQFPITKIERHPFEGRGKDALRKAREWAETNLVGEHTYHKGADDSFTYEITGGKDGSIGKFLSQSSTSNSENLGLHIATMMKLPEIIDKSIDVEIHPSYKKINNKRSADNGIETNDILVHRLYGAVDFNGDTYRVKTTMLEPRNSQNTAHDYRVTKVELLESNPTEGANERVSGSSTSDAQGASATISGTKLLKGVEKSYDPGKKVLDASRFSLAEGEPERRPSIAETAREAMDDQIRWSLAGQPGNVTPTADMAREEYDRRVANKWNKLVTEFQDKNRPVRILIEEIQKVTGNRPIEDYEDYLTMENQQSSVSHAQTENFERFYWMPILKQIDAIMKKLGGKNAYDDIIRYMMSKHGLERNEYYDNERGEVRDWSGLTALYGYESDMVADAEDAARQYVADFENRVGTDDIDELWRLTKEATDKILRHSYAGGNISRDTYDYVRDMFQYYIPLRGFEQDMAEDVYGYLGLGNNRFSGKYKKVGGRTTVADNPIATIMQMAETEISNAASNRAKTALYNYLITRQDTTRLDANGNYIPQSLATIKNAWYEVSTDSEGNRVCRLALPNIPSNASSKQVNEEWNRFEEEMKAKAKSGEAFQSKKGLKLPYPLINDFHGREHAITVNIGGEQKVIWINGDNEAARAVNNTQRKDMGAIEQALRMLNRAISSMFTNYSLGFTARNLFRDTIYSRMAISAKENAEYNLDYRKNWWKNFAGTGAPMMKMLDKYSKGGMRYASGLTATEKTFKEFMENGGETGYTFIHSVEQNKARIEREMKMMKKGRTVSVGKALRWCGESVEFLNQAFELLTRFTAYQTSRDQGRSIQRSIKDAKEVSVNFGTRGAQSGIVARFFGATHFFFNAGMQGMQNFFNLFKTKKGAALTTANLVGLATSGAILVPLLNTWLAYMLGDGDDDDNYYDLPDYIRRNNLCVGWGDNYVMIPLPIELRAIYGMGDIINGVIYDKRADRSLGSISADLVAQAADVLPLNPIEGAADMGTLGSVAYNTFVPDVVSPIVEATLTNRSFSGVPIYKKYTGQEYYPEYMKAYSGAPTALVALAEKLYGLNRGLPPKGGIGLNPMNLNPEVVDHLLKGYGGGMYTLLKQISRLVDDIPAVQKVFPFTEGEKFKVAEVPVIGDLWRHKEEENGQDFASRTYYDFKDIESRVAGRLRPLGSEAQVFSDEDNETTRKARIYGGEYYDVAKEFYLKDKEMRRLTNQINKEEDESKKAELEARLATEKEELVDKLLEMN